MLCPRHYPGVDFALHPATGDLDIDRGELRLVKGSDAIRQRLRIRLGLARGEWYQDLRVGIPLYERVLVSGDDIPTVVGVYAKAITTMEGIRGLVRLEHAYDPGSRELRLFGEAVSVDNDVVPFEHRAFVG